MKAVEGYVVHTDGTSYVRPHVIYEVVVQKWGLISKYFLAEISRKRYFRINLRSWIPTSYEYARGTEVLPIATRKRGLPALCHAHRAHHAHVL